MPEGLRNQEEMGGQPVRAALYVDGFNLYHPIHGLGENHLKWLNLWSLGDLICADRGHALVGVTYCTAYRKDNPDQTARHRAYVQALEYVGVSTILGHYMITPIDGCANCGVAGTKATEKQTDINLALSVFADAMQDRFDWAYLLSADSDQAATAKFLKDHFPGKKLVSVAPPNQEVSTNVLSHADGKRRLNRDDIAKCRFPSIIMRDNGYPIRCPAEYDLP